MPIYEYRCAACGFQKEYLQKMSDAPLTECPECGKPSLAKMVTAAGFQLKGSGWYATDFKTAPKAKTEGESKAPAQLDDKSKAKAEDKPAVAAESKSSPETAATKADAPKTATTSGAGTGST